MKGTRKNRIVIFVILLGIFLVMFFGFAIKVNELLKRKISIQNTSKFMKVGELKITSLSTAPTNRDYAWDSELLNFIVDKLNEAANKGYAGIEYQFGENSIQIEYYLGWNRTILASVNGSSEYCLHNVSIYYSDEDIVIYGFLEKEFNKLTIRKEKENVEIEMLTPNQYVPFSANSIAVDVDMSYCLSIGKQGQVSIYKDKEKIGEDVYLPNGDKAIEIYSGMIYTENENLYKPYIITSDGKQEIYCQKVTEILAEDLRNASYEIDNKVYRIRNYLVLDGMEFPTFEKDGKINILMPDDLKKYKDYTLKCKEISLKSGLGWHWREI